MVSVWPLLDCRKSGGTRLYRTKPAFERPVHERAGRLLDGSPEQSRRQASAADRCKVLAGQKRGTRRRVDDRSSRRGL